MSDIPTTGLDELQEISGDLGDTGPADWPALVIFWVLIIVVAGQFFTRYVMNDSLGWTEEVARYCLIALTFLGSAICVRKGSHLALAVAYSWLPRAAARPLAMAIEATTAAFFGYLGWLSLAMAERAGPQRMISLPVSRSVLYYAVLAGCLLAAFYACRNVLRLSRMTHDEIAEHRIGGL